MMWLGYHAALFLGWSEMERLFAGALVAISSTTIVAKTFDEQKIHGQIRDTVMGILIVEDIIAILLLATLTAAASGQGLSTKALAQTTGGLALFLITLIVVGLFLVPRLIRFVIRINRPETTLVVSIGLCFSIALLVQAFGYSMALGAFLAGTLVSESGASHKIEKLIHPVKDMFAAIFFVSVGMTIDPVMLVEHWQAVLIFTLLVIVGQTLTVSIGSFMTGHPIRTSLQVGMSLAQIGEFSFIIASLGVALNATGHFIFPIAVAVSAITTLTTPWFVRMAVPVSAWVDDHLPQRLQTFVALYGSWIDRIRHSQKKSSQYSRLRRRITMLAVDCITLIAVAIAGSYSQTIAHFIHERLSIPLEISLFLPLVITLLFAIPLSTGIVAITRKIAQDIAEMAIPIPTGGVDNGLTPRRALRMSLQFAFALLIGIPLLTILQPFYSGVGFLALLLLFLLAAGITLWRSTTDLQGHVRAGSQIIAEVLATQTRQKEDQRPQDPLHSMALIHQLLPGLGEPVSLTMKADSIWCGKTLGEINLRGATGATILALHRKGSEHAFIPTADDLLQAGDLVALAGSQQALQLALSLLTETQQNS